MNSCEVLRLYHATDLHGLKGARKSQRLFGHVLSTGPHEGSTANLTTDKNAARRFIISYRGEGQWIPEQGPPRLFLLSFRIPKELTHYVGPTYGFGCPEYATTLRVDAQDVPTNYLNHLHAGDGLRRMSVEEAVRLQEQGKLWFYQVPLRQYLYKVEPISFTYRGRTYPLKK